jgi:aspartate ammonia-lyase
LGICSPEDLVEATQDSGEFSLISSIMKTAAVQPSKICNDLALELSSGPRCGLYELRLSPLQPGSSVMPGQRESGDSRSRQPDLFPDHLRRWTISI